jgi:hypothetical protein
MIQLLPTCKSPGSSDITYTIIKKGDPPLWTVLHHLFTRKWNLTSPHTHDGALVVSPTQWSLNLLKPVHNPPKPPSDPHNYRGIGLGDTLGMIYQVDLQHELLNYTSTNDLLTSAQDTCQTNRQPYDTVYTLTEFITSRHETQRLPTFVFFGDIVLVFPTVNREILLVRLHATDVPPKLCQHVRVLHHTLKYRILHGHSKYNPYIEILKGLTEGGRLSPLLWGLYVTDLVTVMCILLYVDDFYLIASSGDQFMVMMQDTQTWCENNRLTISTTSTRKNHATRDVTHWTIRRDFPLLSTPLPIDEVSQVVFIGITVDPTLTYHLHCTKIIRSIQMVTNHLLFARKATPNLCTHSIMILYRLWVSGVRDDSIPTLTPDRGGRYHDSIPTQTPNLHPDSLEQCTRTVLIRLGRSLDYNQFVLPDSVTRTQTSTVTLLQLRAQSSFLTTHRHYVLPSPVHPGIPYRSFQHHFCPYCLIITGDETHMFLDYPRLVSSLSPRLDEYFTLLSSYELQTTPLLTLDYLSLLAADPSPCIQDLDRLE